MGYRKVWPSAEEAKTLKRTCPENPLILFDFEIFKCITAGAAQISICLSM